MLKNFGLRKKLADDEQVVQLTEQLRQAVTEHFGVRQESREYEIQMLKRRVEKLEAEVAERRQGQSAAIDRRMEQLMTGEENRKSPKGHPERAGPSDHPRHRPHHRPHDSRDSDNPL